MEWRKWYLDLVLVPFGILFTIAYHCWLWYKVRTQPLSTSIGINSAGQHLWVSATMKDNEKKNLVAVQTLRNMVMGSTLMATTAILLCGGLAAMISSTYSIKKPLSDSVYGAQGEFMVAIKYVCLLVIFLFAFLCHSLAIRFVNQVSIFINAPQDPVGVITPEYVTELLVKGFILNVAGNRLFYSALPLMLWILGPVMVFLCSMSMIPILYNLDFVVVSGRDGVKERRGK